MTNASQDELNFVRGMISAWVERGFQLAVGYVGALVVVGVGASSESFADVIVDWQLTRTGALVGAVSILNGLYLSLVSVSVIAVLKRAYFITCNASRQSLAYQWEAYSRTPEIVEGSDTVYRRALAPIRWFFWTADNMSVVPLYVLVWGLSGGIIVRTVPLLEGINDWLVMGAAVLLHILAAVLAWGVWDWNARCYRALEDADDGKTGEVLASPSRDQDDGRLSS